MASGTTAQHRRKINGRWQHVFGVSRLADGSVLSDRVHMYSLVHFVLSDSAGAALVWLL